MLELIGSLGTCYFGMVILCTMLLVNLAFPMKPKASNLVTFAILGSHCCFIVMRQAD